MNYSPQYVPTMKKRCRNQINYKFVSFVKVVSNRINLVIKGDTEKLLLPKIFRRLMSLT